MRRPIHGGCATGSTPAQSERAPPCLRFPLACPPGAGTRYRCACFRHASCPLQDPAEPAAHMAGKCGTCVPHASLVQELSPRDHVRANAPAHPLSAVIRGEGMQGRLRGAARGVHGSRAGLHGHASGHLAHRAARRAIAVRAAKSSTRVRLRRGVGSVPLAPALLGRSCKSTGIQTFTQPVRCRVSAQQTALTGLRSAGCAAGSAAGPRLATSFDQGDSHPGAVLQGWLRPWLQRWRCVPRSRCAGERLSPGARPCNRAF